MGVLACAHTSQHGQDSGEHSALGKVFKQSKKHVIKNLDQEKQHLEHKKRNQL